MPLFLRVYDFRSYSAAQIGVGQQGGGRGIALRHHSTDPRRLRQHGSLVQRHGRDTSLQVTIFHLPYPLYAEKDLISVMRCHCSEIASRNISGQAPEIGCRLLSSSSPRSGFSQDSHEPLPSPPYRLKLSVPLSSSRATMDKLMMNK